MQTTAFTPRSEVKYLSVAIPVTIYLTPLGNNTVWVKFRSYMLFHIPFFISYSKALIYETSEFYIHVHAQELRSITEIGGGGGGDLSSACSFAALASEFTMNVSIEYSVQLYIHVYINSRYSTHAIESVL